MPGHSSLSLLQSQACLTLLRDRDVDLAVLRTAVAALEQAGTLNSSAAKVLRQFFRTEGQDALARGSIMDVCGQLLRQHGNWQQVIADLNDADLNGVLGTGMMLMSGRADVSDADRDQMMLEGTGLVLARYLREKAVLALRRCDVLGADALMLLRSLLQDPKEKRSVAEYTMMTLVSLSRQNPAARALFLDLLRDETLEDWKFSRVAQALTNMSPLEMPEVEALRLAMRADNRQNRRGYAAQALLFAGALDEPNTEAFIMALRDLKTTRLRQNSPMVQRELNSNAGAAESATFRQKAEASALREAQNKNDTDIYERCISELLSRHLRSEAAVTLLARIVRDEAIPCELRAAAIRELDTRQVEHAVAESDLAQCLHQPDCDDTLNEGIIDLLRQRKSLQPETIAALVEAATDKRRSTKFRKHLMHGFEAVKRLQSAQAKRLFAIAEDTGEEAYLRGEMISILTATKSLKKPMLARLVVWVREAATPRELRGKAAIGLLASGSLQQIERESLLNFLRDTDLNEWTRVCVGTAVATSQNLDTETIQVLLELAASARGESMNLYNLLSALWQAARREASVFTAITAFLRDKKADAEGQCNLIYALPTWEPLPADMIFVLRAMADDKAAGKHVRKALHSLEPLRP